jgi:sulfhydrogenase subunit beta (sulfur reductase)
VVDPAAVDLEYQTTILPLKKFFLPPTDTLLRCDMATQESALPRDEHPARLFFGIHNYDLQGLKRLDYAFTSGVRDESWISRRQDCLFVGVSYTPDEHHFSDSVGIPVGLKDGFDLFLTDAGDLFRVEALTDAGTGLLDEIRPLLVPSNGTSDPVPHFRNKLRLSVAGVREVFPGAYASQVWKETARRCHSCGTCTMVCPTCYCFDVNDEVDLGSRSGRRTRSWDSCLFETHALVAGGENFREHRSSRIKFRYYHKQRGFVAEYGRPSCVGCGRCIAGCPAGIDIVSVIEKLRGDKDGSGRAEAPTQGN